MSSILLFLWIFVTVLYPAATTHAELCDKCKKMSFDAAIGKCQKCGKDTSSLAFKLCSECSIKFDECEHCRKKLDKKDEAAQRKSNHKITSKKQADSKVSNIAKMAESFWDAVKTANIQKMQEYYDKQVILLPGSELLREQWGMKTEPNESGACIVPTNELLKAYEALINKTGKEIWRKRFDEISPRIVSTETAKTDNQLLNGVKSGDIIMKVMNMVGGECFYYVWRKDSNGQLRIVIELADY